MVKLQLPLHTIPLISFEAGPRKERARSGYYWISDIIDIQAKLKELEAQPERLTEFQTERKELVEDINRVSENSEHNSSI